MLNLREKPSYSRSIFVLAACALMLAGITHRLWAEENSPEEQAAEKPGQLAVASDQSAEDVAREIIRLQQQLGGSVVQTPPHWRFSNDVLKNALIADDDSDGWTAYPPELSSSAITLVAKVSELREAALNLDKTAHRLEIIDLYDQADALRNVATRLRRDAREMKQQANAATADMLRFLTPTQPDLKSSKDQ